MSEAVLSPTATEGPAPVRLRVWDLPLRLFHWGLVLLVAAAVVTAKIGGDWMVWHGRAGIAIIGLLAFRLVWGFAGSTAARFRSFFPTPGRVRAYVTGRWQGIGHNPLGALSVLVLLGLLLAQALTGLFTNDDIAYAGPFSERVDEALASALGGWHHRLSNVLLGFIGLHLVAILAHWAFKRDNLIRPMLTGWKQAPTAFDLRRASAWALAAALALAGAAIYGASGGAF